MGPGYRWISPTAKVQLITQRKRSRKEHELHRLQLRLLDFVRKLCTLLVLHGEAKPACTSFLQTLRSLVKFLSSMCWNQCSQRTCHGSMEKKQARLFSISTALPVTCVLPRMLGWILMGSSTLLNFNGWPILLVYQRWTSLETGG